MLHRALSNNMKNFLLIAALVLSFPLTAGASVDVGHSNATTLTGGLMGYWPFDGATTNWSTGKTSDISGQGNTGSLVSMSTTTSSVAGKLGQALNFNGSNDVLVNAAALSAPCTVTVWVKIQNNGSTSHGYPITNDGSYSIRAQQFNVTTVGETHYGVGDYSFSPSYTLTAGKWTFLAFVNGASTATLYVNGVSQGTISQTLNCPRLTIGGAGSDFYSGSLDDVRMYNRALSAQEIAQLYTDGGGTLAHSSTVTLNTSLVAYWPLDGSTINWSTGTAADSSGNGNAGSLIGLSTTTSPTAGKIGQAIYFKSAGQYISSSVSASVSTYSVAAWVRYQGSAPSGPKVAVGYGAGGNPNTIWMGYTTGGLAISNSSVDLVKGTNATSTWHYLVASVQANTMTAYVDGVAIGTDSMTSRASNTLVIGDYVGLGFAFNGSVDDVRVYNRALSVAEVNQLYGQGQVMVAHSPSGASGQSSSLLSSGLIGYWTFDGNKISWSTPAVLDSSGSGNSLTMTSMSAVTSPSIGKIGQALKFNGSNQSLSHSSISAFNFGTGDFSVSFWMNPVSPWGTAATEGVLGQKTSDSFNGWQIYQDSGHPGILDMRLTQQNNFLTNSTIPTSKWTLATFVRQGSNTFWYLNGVQDSTGSNSSSLSDAGSFYIGYAPTWSAYYSGALDDVRVYNRALSAGEVAQLYAATK